MRFRFSIRDLLWLTLVVALAVALWQARSRIVDLQDRNAILEKTSYHIDMVTLEHSNRAAWREVERLKETTQKLGGAASEGK